MSLTSAAERRSATSVGLPWRGTLPLPDGAIGGDDRGQVAAFYRGVIEPTVTVPTQVNTRAKRRAAIHVGLPWRGIIPEPDGEIEKADRVEVAVFYRGVIEPTVTVPTQVNTRSRRRAAIHVGLPWRGIIPEPDGEIEKADRVEVAVFYRGFFEVPTPTPTPTPTPVDTSVVGGGGGGRSRRRGMPQLTRPSAPVVRRVRPKPIMTDDEELALLIPLMMEVLTNANAR